jgi:lipoyl(octanoyl) transferase
MNPDDNPVHNPVDNIEWKVSDALVPYPEALAWMEARATAIAQGTARECVWLLEHPPLYTAGTSADVAELLDDRFPVFDAGRGGRYTYHGPGQRIGYLMIDLNKRGRDVRRFVHAVEGWVIATLGKLDVPARREPGRIGIWTDDPGLEGGSGQEAKIGAIGIRIRRWVSLHGFSVNIAPDLSHFGGIVPCGLAEFAVTSMANLGKTTEISAFDSVLYEGMPDFLNEIGANNPLEGVRKKS